MAGCPLTLAPSGAFPCEADGDCASGYLCSDDALCAPDEEVLQTRREDGGEPDVVEPEPEPPNDGGGEPDVVVDGGGEPEPPNDGGGEPDVVVDGGGEPEPPNDGGGEPDVVVDGGGEPDVVVDGGGEPDVVVDGGGEPDVVVDGGGDAGVESDAGVVNEPPVFDPLELVFCRENRDCGVTVSYSDPDNQVGAHTLRILTPPSNGVINRNDETHVQYVPNTDYIGADSFVVEVADEKGATDTLTVELLVVRHHTCQTIRTTSNELLVSGVHPLDPDGQGDINAYCHMEGSDGWTLVMKADGNNDTFGYDADLWEDDNVLAADELNLASTETKTEAFLRHPVDEVRLVFSEVGANSFGNLLQQTNTQLDVSVTARSMRELMNRGYTRSHEGWSAWDSLTPTSYQYYCDHEGFNVDLRYSENNTDFRYRIGILYDDNSSCNGRAGVGVGGAGTGCAGEEVVVGGVYDCVNFSPAQHDRVFAAVFVKAASRVEVLSNCDEHRQNGGTTNGLYYVDNGDPDEVQQVYCNQTADGGGWMLVGRTGGNGRGGFGWSSRTGSAATVDNWYYSLDPVRMGFTPSEILVAFGDGSSNNAYSNAYKWPRTNESIPADFLQSYGDANFRTRNVTVVAGNCSPNDDRAFEYIGYTDNTDRFYFDDDNSNQNQGMYSNQFYLRGHGGSCNDNGYLDGDPGVMFIR